MNTLSFKELIEASVLRVSDGYRAKNEELAGDGPVFLRSAYLQKNGFVLSDPDRFQGSDTTRFRDKIAVKGDSVITTKGNSTGRVGYVSGNVEGAVYSPHLSYWRSLDQEVIWPRYLYYWSRSEEFQSQLHGFAYATDMAPYFSLRDQMFLRITLPAISEQREIATILGALDDKIELNRRMAATLEEMARSLYRSWFVDFDPVHAKAAGRPPAHMDTPTAALFPDRFGDDGLPEGWRRVLTGEIITFTKGRSYKSAELQDSTTALISLKSFQRGGGYRHDGLKAFTGSYKPEQVVEPGELVISLTDVTQAAELIGRATFARSSRAFNKLVASLDVGIIRAVDPAVTPQEFLHQTFNCEEFLDHAVAHTSGTTVLHLAKDAIPNYRMILPTLSIVTAYQDLSAPIRDRVFQVETESETLATLRDSLLPKLMSGELRVGAARELVEDVA